MTDRDITHNIEPRAIHPVCPSCQDVRVIEVPSDGPERLWKCTRCWFEWTFGTISERHTETCEREVLSDDLHTCTPKEPESREPSGFMLDEARAWCFANSINSSKAYPLASLLDASYHRGIRDGEERERQANLPDGPRLNPPGEH